MVPTFEQSGAVFVGRGARYEATVDATGLRLHSGDSVRFPGARNAACRGEGRSVAHFLLGRDAAGWQRDRVRYRQVRCTAAYPGIDLVYYFDPAGLLEFDFEVAPGADPSVIRVQRAGRGLRLQPPVAWQGDRRVAVRLEGTRFRTGGYDRRRTLVIDPKVEYGSYLGGSGGSTGETLAVAPDGSVYVSGNVTSNYFPTVNPLQPSFAGSNDMYLAKFSADGSELLFSTYIGGWGDDRVRALAIDAKGNVWLAGFTTSHEFPMVQPIQDRFAGGNQANGGDAFVMAIDPNGREILFSTFLGGSADDFARGIWMAGDGSVWICGSTLSADFPLVGALQTEIGGNRDGFLLKLAPDGSAILFSTYIGGGAADELHGLALDSAGNVVAVGTTVSQDLPVVEPLQPTYGGGSRDVLVVKLLADLSRWQLVSWMGGTAEDFGRAVAVDSGDNIYLTGFTWSGAATFPLRNAWDASYGGNRDGFLTKLTAAGQYAYNTYVGAGSVEEGFTVAVNGADEVVVAGFTQSNAFPRVDPIQNTINNATCSTQPCTADVFITRFRSTGGAPLFSTYLGGSGADQARAVAFSPEGTLWLTGFTASANLPVPNGLFVRNAGGGANVAMLLQISGLR